MFKLMSKNLNSKYGIKYNTRFSCCADIHFLVPIVQRRDAECLAKYISVVYLGMTVMIFSVVYLKDYYKCAVM